LHSKGRDERPGMAMPHEAEELPRSASHSGRKASFREVSLTPFAANDGNPKVERSAADLPAGAQGMKTTSNSIYSNTQREVPSKRQPSFFQDLAPVKKSPEPAAGEVPLKLRIDGPFGAAAQGYRDYSVMLLIGAGIGVTPFASVLSDLVHRMRHVPNPGKEGSAVPRFQKVYFYWSIRSQSEVMWFSRVLEAISNEDVHKILDINVHITGLRKSNDVRTMPLKLVQVAVHKQTGMDVMSGLNGRVLTRFGRPDWARVFRDLQIRHSKEKKIGVFYSGPNTLASVLKRLSNKYSTHGNKFNFTKEAFGYW